MLHMALNFQLDVSRYNRNNDRDAIREMRLKKMEQLTRQFSLGEKVRLNKDFMSGSQTSFTGEDGSESETGTESMVMTSAETESATAGEMTRLGMGNNALASRG